MFAIKNFTITDLERINTINLDPYTETYGLHFYVQYMGGKLPYVFYKAEDPHGRLAGYLMGKIEGEGENYHGHITAVTVAVDFRRQGVAKMLMNKFEQICLENDCYFIDLYVRVSNKVAVEMYTKMGYALPRDVERKSMIPKPRPVTCAEAFGNNEQ
ncbi:hypothetical protein FO519_004295 [Halicephalobus sp. NKZ332]|nr:hypothetical protein FO519_004295 [Halicephalobus sp. NKZ332]